MKNLFKALVYGLLILMPAMAWAQRPSFKPSASFMAYGSQVDGDRFGGYHKFNFAAYVETERVNRKAIQWSLGLGFAQRGAFRRPNPDKGIFTQYKMQLNYIGVPLRFIVKQQKKRNGFLFYVAFGAEVLALVSDRESDENGTLDRTAEFERITTDALLDLGFQEEEWNIFVCFRYSALPVRVLDAQNGNFDSNLRQYNNLVGLGIRRNF